MPLTKQQESKIMKDLEDEDDRIVQEAEYAKRYDRLHYAGSDAGKKAQDIKEFNELHRLISKRPNGNKRIKELKESVDKKYRELKF